MNNYYHLNHAYWETPLEFHGVYVAQIGRQYCKSGAVIRPHVHTDLFELTIVTDGEGIVTTNGVEAKVKKGDIYLSLPCDVHMIQSDGEKLLKYDFFAFKVSGSQFDAEFNMILQTYRDAHQRVFSDNRIDQLIANAIAELNSENVFSNEILESVFNQVLIYVIRSFKQKTVTATLNKSKSEILCYKLMNYIDTHIYTMKTLTELSAVTDYSYGYLSALFKKTTSISLASYYCKKKLDAAKLLILEEKLTATQIAELLNYSSVYAFSKAFKKEFGASPKKFKRQ